MQCLVINLDRSIERMVHIEKQFGDCGVQFQRMPGCDAKTMNSDSLLALQSKNSTYRKMSASEIGCMLSHRICWEIAANSTEEYTAVFEDDIYLSSSAGTFLNNASWIPHGAKCVRLETGYQPATISRSKTQLSNDYTLNKLLSVQYGAAGYIISKKFASDLIKKSDPIPCIADEFIFGKKYMAKNEISIYQISPAICIQSRLITGTYEKFDTLIDWGGEKSPVKIKLSVGNKVKREILRFFRKLPNLPYAIYTFVVSKKETIAFK